MNVQLADTPAARNLNQGRLVVTMISKKTGEHITLRVRCKNRDLRKRYITLQDAAIITADIPHGRKEDGSHTTLGDRVAWIHAFRGIQPNRGADSARVWAFEKLWQYLLTGDLHPQMELKIESFCARCSRPISHQDSIERGMGPECYGKAYEHKHQTKNKRAADPAPDAFEQIALSI